MEKLARCWCIVDLVSSAAAASIGVVSSAHLERVDETLLLLSEARERAEQAARTIAADGGQSHLVEALGAVDRELLALHRRLMDETYFRPTGTVVEAAEQLAL